MSYSANWKDHPLVVAAISAAGTFTITTFAFKEIIIPTQIAEIQNKIRDLPLLEQNLQTLKKTNHNNLIAISDLKRKIEGLQQKDLFEAESPIPALLRNVKIGQNILNLEKVFPQAKITKNEEIGYWSINLGFGLIPKATYYYDVNSKKREITHILYWLSDNPDLSDEFLKDRLIDSIGEPTKSPIKGFYEWRMKKYNVFMSDKNTYAVFDSEAKPGYWPD